jgi:hypothetical protein
MVRRTSGDVIHYFADDIHKQGLAFPEVAPPEKIAYQFSGKIEKVFNDTIKLLRDFKICTLYSFNLCGRRAAIGFPVATAEKYRWFFEESAG